MTMATGNETRTLATLALALAGMLLLGGGLALAAPVPPPRPDNGWLLDEGSGTALGQWNGSRTGNLAGPVLPTWSADTPFAYAGNSSLAFVATGGPALGNYARLDGQGVGTQGTVAFWVKDEAAASPAYILDSNSGRTLMYRTPPVPPGTFGTYVNGSSIGGVSGAIVPGPGSGSPWTHLAIVWDNSDPTQKQKVYQNGSLFTTRNVTLGTTNPSNIYLGSRQSLNETWGGKIDEYALWSRPLSGNEVAWLAANSLSTTPNTLPSNPNKAWLFNEGSGSTAFPFFGSDNGTLQSNVGWAPNNPGRHGSGTSLHFDGTSDNRVNFPSHSFGTEGTIALWAYKDTADTAPRYLFDASSGARSLLYRSGGGWSLYLNNQSIGTMSPSLIPDFDWTHLVVTWDNALPFERIKVYQNGDLFTTFNNSLSPTVPSMLWLGNRFSNNESWLGYLDDFALWDRALAPGEVDWLFENSVATLPEPGTLSLLALGGAAAWWRRRRRSFRN